MKRRRVWLDTIDGRKAVKVGVLGLFAVHRVARSGSLSKEWKVTHVPTGRAILPLLDPTAFWPSKSVAVAVARMLNRLPVRWDFVTDADMPKTTLRRGQAALRRFERELARKKAA